MAYSTVDDLLLGDATFSGALNRQAFVERAAEEINSKLGFIYDLPLAPTPPLEAMPEAERLLLKSINNNLASGRLILAMALGGEDASLQAYGKYLVDQAMQELMLLANYEIQLQAVRLISEEISDTENFAPGVVNIDEESGVTAFQNNTMRGESWYWRPGAVT